MATKTRYLPGYGVIVDVESGDEKMLPGYGAVTMNEAAAGTLNNDRISATHFMRPWEPHAVGV